MRVTFVNRWLTFWTNLWFDDVVMHGVPLVTIYDGELFIKAEEVYATVKLETDGATTLLVVARKETG